MKKFVLGIGGRLCAGKSLAGEYFESRGAVRVDADKIVNDLYRPGCDGHRRISSFFGEDFLTSDGEVDRKKLARFVFGDRAKLHILNTLIHPLVCNEIRKIIDTDLR